MYENSNSKGIQYLIEMFQYAALHVLNIYRFCILLETHNTHIYLNIFYFFNDKKYINLL